MKLIGEKENLGIGSGKTMGDTGMGPGEVMCIGRQAGADGTEPYPPTTPPCLFPPAGWCRKPSWCVCPRH